MTAARTTFTPDAASVPATRRFVSDVLVSWGLPAVVDAVEVLVSEVATNAVLHGRTPFSVEVERDATTVRVRVSDRSSVVPRQRSYGTEATTGRGIRLVARLAARWGVEPVDGGKTVWFEVPVDTGAQGTFDEWDDEMDVDALVARFDDTEPAAAFGNDGTATALGLAA